MIIQILFQGETSSSSSPEINSKSSKSESAGDCCFLLLITDVVTFESSSTDSGFSAISPEALKNNLFFKKFREINVKVSCKSSVSLSINSLQSEEKQKVYSHQKIIRLHYYLVISRNIFFEKESFSFLLTVQRIIILSHETFVKQFHDFFYLEQLSSRTT